MENLSTSRIDLLQCFARHFTQGRFNFKGLIPIPSRIKSIFQFRDVALKYFKVFLKQIFFN
jgi:hypothetical protein